ncbi:hypothetical protein B6I21_03670 [candidate division KSB1 bacterium 4572_119]|nr:MAG: hypothetical protein B6I21_03670 [candidate division KSB1 bacterium 4572_119]
MFPIFDGDNGENLKDYDDLTANENLKKWVTEPPNAYCNSKFILDFDFPGHLRNYFRWKVSYERNELEHFISQYAGRKIGSLFEILPSLRNHSGRIQEVEILASDTNLTITGEREICKSLSEKGLPSTCFYVEPQLDADGFPLSFTFYGAGFGNGAGLCQAGAYNMALKGASYDEILKHYFRNINIKKIYED